MKTFKLLAVILAVCMIVTTFVGCELEEITSTNALETSQDTILGQEETTSAAPEKAETTEIVPEPDVDDTPDAAPEKAETTEIVPEPDVDDTPDADDTSDADDTPDIPTNANTNPDTTAKYDGITVTKLPFAVKGIIINSISFSGTKVTVSVINNTGYAIQDISNLTYKCYDSYGTILETGSLYLEAMNNGESAEVYFYAESGTSKILFTDATIYRGDASADQETQVQDGFTINKLPFEIKGIKITSIAFNGTKVTVRVTNNTGYAIQDISNLAYKCYDSNGIILETGDLYLEDMNNGETAEVYFYMESGTSKVVLVDATVYKK